MNQRLIFSALLAAALGCSDGTLHPGGTGGTSGSGTAGTTGTGTAGTTGGAGTGGDIGGGGTGGTGGTGTAGTTGAAGAGGTGGSPYPPCGVGDGQSATVAGSIVDSGGMPVVTSTAATVTVSAVESSPASSTLRVTLADAATPQQWIWSLAMTSLPNDRLKVGDQFDLTIDARECDIPLSHAPCQTVVLAHGNSMIVFTAESWGVRSPSTPALEPWGIAVADLGPFCASTDQFCEHRTHATRVTAGSATGTLAPGQILSLADASFVLGTFDQTVDHGICDLGGRLTMGGFRAP